MKKTIITAVLALAIAVPASALAQSGSKPGLYDGSNIRGWTIFPSGDPNITQWVHQETASSAGTNCNIVNATVPLSNEEFQNAMSTVNVEELRRQLTAASGVSYQEISPIQVADFDGLRAHRLTARISAQGLVLTAYQMQAVIRGNVVAVTCGSSEAAFGSLAPTLERFIDDVQFASGFTSAKIENEEDTEFPSLLATSAEEQEDSVIDLLGHGAELLVSSSASE